jgi:hypothetical protein
MKPVNMPPLMTPARLSEQRAEAHRKLEDSQEAFASPRKPPRYDEMFLNGAQKPRAEADGAGPGTATSAPNPSVSKLRDVLDTGLAWANAMGQQNLLPRSAILEAEFAHLRAIRNWAARAQIARVGL